MTNTNDSKNSLFQKILEYVYKLIDLIRGKKDNSYVDEDTHHIIIPPPVEMPVEVPVVTQPVTIPTPPPHTQPDKAHDAKRLARAIATVESGGKQVHGASGEFGIFQFSPGTWKACSAQYNQAVNGVAWAMPQNAANEWKCATWKIGELLKKWTPEEVALIWNSSLMGQEIPKRIKGINSAGVAYDSQAYANKVVKVYNSLPVEIAIV